MTIGNIIDNRSNQHNVRCDAVFEDSWHDNKVEGATQFEADIPESIGYAELRDTTVAEALTKANDYLGPITVFLYDIGSIGQRCSSEELDRRLEVVALRRELRQAVAQANKEAPADRAVMRDSVLAVLAEEGIL